MQKFDTDYQSETFWQYLDQPSPPWVPRKCVLRVWTFLRALRSWESWCYVNIDLAMLNALSVAAWDGCSRCKNFVRICFAMAIALTAALAFISCLFWRKLCSSLQSSSRHCTLASFRLKVFKKEKLLCLRKASWRPKWPIWTGVLSSGVLLSGTQMYILLSSDGKRHTWMARSSLLNVIRRASSSSTKLIQNVGIWLWTTIDLFQVDMCHNIWVIRCTWKVNNYVMTPRIK